MAAPCCPPGGNVAGGPVTDQSGLRESKPPGLIDFFVNPASQKLSIGITATPLLPKVDTALPRAYHTDMESPSEKALAREIAALLAAGLPQDAAVAHFIASTHGALSPRELETLVTDREDPQAASLIELLLFPGETVARTLEPGLAAAGLDAAGEKRLARALEELAPRAVAVLPDGTRLTIPLAPDDLRRFVSRLAPTRTLPPGIGRIVASRFGAAAALETAVAARQTGPDWTARNTAFFTALADRLPPEAADTLAALHYGLRFTAGLAPTDLPIPALIARHGRLAAQLRRARQQEQALAASNFETLILGGNRLPYLHAPDIAREMALAEALILAVTGRPAPDTGGSCLNLGVVEDVDGLVAVLSAQTD